MIGLICSKHKFLKLSTVFILSINLYAEDIKQISEKVHLSNINALLIFTSQKAVGSGHYVFTNIDVDADIYALPFRHNFKSNTDLNYFVSGSFGYSDVRAEDGVSSESDPNIIYDNHINTYIGGLGGGLRYKLGEKFHILGGVEFIYSRSGATVKERGKNEIGSAVEDFFDNNYNENISYKLFSEIEYRPVVEGFHPYATLSFKYYETKSGFSFDELSTFNSQSSVITFELGVETPSIFYYNENYMTLEGYLNGNYLKGEVTTATTIKAYTTTGAIAYWYTPSKPLYARRFFVEVNSINASGLYGFNVGVGLSIGF